jgi:hypothetical protein
VSREGAHATARGLHLIGPDFHNVSVSLFPRPVQARAPLTMSLPVCD